jgi:hypothetical protein
VPRDGLLDLLHGVSLHSSYDIVDAVDDVDFFHVGDLSELLQEILFSTKVSVNKYKSLGDFRFTSTLPSISTCGNNPSSLFCIWHPTHGVAVYRYWSQVAGYFDGDGTIATSDISNRPYKITLSLFFVDHSIDQISAVKEFLNDHGVKTSNVLKRSDGETYELAVSQFKSVKKALRRMLPFLCKKETEARVALDYYEGKVTGNQLLVVFAAEVEAGRRERKTRTVLLDVPYTRPEGDRMMEH